MARAQRMTLGEVHRTRTSPFFKQIFVLLLTIIIGVLISVSVNAQATAGKKSKRTYKKTKNRARPNFYASSDKTVIIPHLPAVGSLQQQFIREIVSQSLRERRTSEPFEIAPLVYAIDGRQLTIKDSNPFLIALEFALQGQVIVIDDQPITNDQYKAYTKEQVVQEVIALMKTMGAPGERIRTGDVQVEGGSDAADDNLLVRLAVL